MLDMIINDDWVFVEMGSRDSSSHASLHAHLSAPVSINTNLTVHHKANAITCNYICFSEQGPDAFVCCSGCLGTSLLI